MAYKQPYLRGASIGWASQTLYSTAPGMGRWLWPLHIALSNTTRVQQLLLLLLLSVNVPAIQLLHLCLGPNFVTMGPSMYWTDQPAPHMYSALVSILLSSSCSSSSAYNMHAGSRPAVRMIGFGELREVEEESRHSARQIQSYTQQACYLRACLQALTNALGRYPSWY